MRFVERLKRLVRYLRDKASKRIIRPPAMVESVLTAEEQDQLLKKSLVAEGVIEIPLMPPQASKVKAPCDHRDWRLSGDPD